MVESSLNKERLALTLFLVLLTMNNLYAKDHILERQVLSNKMFNCSGLHLTDLFIDDANNISVLAEVRGLRDAKIFLYANNSWTRVDKYGILLNGFIKDGCFHLAFEKDQNIVIYKVQKDIKIVSRISIADFSSKLSRYGNIDRVIPVSGSNNSYYLLTHRSNSPVHPVEFLMDVLSAGHGIHYQKPFLIQVRDKKLAKPRKIPYGGKIDESFIIKEVIKGKDSIHFLGFRGAETPETSGPSGFAWDTPVILHYVDYNFKKKKATRKHSIFKDTPDLLSYYYGPLSMDDLEDDVFVVFSWVQHKSKPRPIPIKDIKSDIYYYQYSDNASGDIEKIGNGFMSLVRVDSLGDVHILWVDSDGGLVHKVKKDNKWSDEEIIINGVDIYPNFAHTRYISAEFDKGNNLHVVFPSKGNLVYAKVKLDFTLDKQD